MGIAVWTTTAIGFMRALRQVLDTTVVQALWVALLAIVTQAPLAGFPTSIAGAS